MVESTGYYLYKYELGGMLEFGVITSLSKKSGEVDWGERKTIFTSVDGVIENTNMILSFYSASDFNYRAVTGENNIIRKIFE